MVIDGAGMPMALPDDSTNVQNDEDPWAESYAQQLGQAWVAFFANVGQESGGQLEVTEAYVGKNVSRPAKSHGSAENSPILIDSGSPSTVVGMKWTECWAKQEEFNFGLPTRDFRFGDGKRQPRMGAVMLEMHLPCSVTNQPQPTNIKIATDVAHGDVPLLVSKKPLVATDGKLVFHGRCYK